MSHFSVVVIGEDIEGQLAPYCEQDEDFMVFQAIGQEQFEKFKLEYPDSDKAMQLGYVEYQEECKNEGTEPLSYLDFWAEDYHGAQKHEGHEGMGIMTNPQSKWDWYEIGGRWSGFFKLKSGATGQKYGQYFRAENPDVVTTEADVVTIKDWDLESARAKAAKEAEEYYMKADKILAGRPLVSWDEMLKKNDGNINLAREEYHSNEVMKDFRAADMFVWDGPESVLGSTKEQYIASQVNNTGVPYAIVKDGTWYEKGEMGWFGVSLNDKDPEQWANEFWKLLEELPPETKLTMVDCHI